MKSRPLKGARSAKHAILDNRLPQEYSIEGQYTKETKKLGKTVMGKGIKIGRQRNITMISDGLFALDRQDWEEINRRREAVTFSKEPPLGSHCTQEAFDEDLFVTNGVPVACCEGKDLILHEHSGRDGATNLFEAFFDSMHASMHLHPA